MVRSYINGLIGLALSLAVISCSKDTEPMPDPGEEVADGRVYSFNIAGRTNNDPNATEHEGIRTVTLVFTDEADRIVAVENIGRNFQTNTTSGPVLSGTVKVKLDESAKYVYAFANLDSENLTNRDEIQKAWTTGTVFDKEAIARIAANREERQDEDGNETEGEDNPHYLTVDSNNTIPMSSHRYPIPEKGGTEDYPVQIDNIILYRMIAKVKVTLKNNTEKAVTINSLTLGNFQRRDIRLLPYEGLKDMTEPTNEYPNIRPVFPTSTETAKPIPSYSLPILSEATLFGEGKELDPYYTHYIHETDLGTSDTETAGSNHFTVSAEIGDGEKVTLADTEFSFVRRNDFLHIPLLLDLNRLVITLTESYAPIGGYPIKNPFENTENGTMITVHEGSTIELMTQVENTSGKHVPDDLRLTHKSGPELLHYDATADESGTYTAQIPAQPTSNPSVYTLTGKLGGTAYKRDLTFTVVNLGVAATRATKSAPRSAGARLVLEEFYQLSCQTDE